MTVLYWYLIISVLLGVGWLLYFAGCDLHSKYKNKRGCNYRYYFSDDLCQVVIITLSWSVPIVNIITLFLLLGLFIQPKKSKD